MTDQRGDDGFDGELREFLAWHAGELHGAPSAGDVASRITARTGSPAGWRLTPELMWIVLAAALIALAVATAAFFGGRSRVLSPLRISNGLVAYSNQPGWLQIGRTDFAAGGDIFLTRAGTAPELIVSRGADLNTNVCPRFSPDGSMLVYGERTRSGRTLVVLEVAASGSVSENRRLAVPGDGLAPCAEWTRNGRALVYRDRQETPLSGVGDAGLVAVVTLSGAVVEATEQEAQLVFAPTVSTVNHAGPESRMWPAGAEHGLAPPILSPDGTSVAFQDDRGSLVVTKADGSDAKHIVDGSTFYTIAGWSPDGRYVLGFEDAIAVRLVAVSVTDEQEFIVLAPSIAINGSRSYPGLGDVSWQSIYEPAAQE